MLENGAFELTRRLKDFLTNTGQFNIHLEFSSDAG